MWVHKNRGFAGAPGAGRIEAAPVRGDGELAFFEPIGVLAMLTIFVAAAAIAGIYFTRGEAPMPAAPKVISTFPTQGATVAPGRINLSVTFDRPMRPQSYSFVQKSAETYPDCGANQPVQSADGRTFKLTCKLEPGRRYEVWFNNPPYMNFVDPNGAPAVPFGLSFQTTPDSNRSR